MFTTLPKTPAEFFKASADCFQSFPKTEADVKEIFEKTTAVLKTEAKNTKDMLEIYKKASSGDASVNEISRANKLAQELATTARFVWMMAIPGAVFMLPTIIEFTKELDVEIVPASVAKEFNIQ